MACFLVPTAEAIVVTAVAQIMKSRAAKKASLPTFSEDSAETPKIPMYRKLHWLASLLWGGSFLLCFEHIWHGEVVPWFPFLTATADPADTAVMLQEMMTVGTSMAVLLTVVWVGMVLVANHLAKKEPSPLTAQAERS